MLNNNIIDFIKTIKFLPKKFNSDNKADKYISNFIIILENYSLINNKDYFVILLNDLKLIENKIDYSTILFSAIIYLDYSLFNEIYKLGFTINNPDYFNINTLLYKIYKHDNNAISINNKIIFLKNYYVINNKLIYCFNYIFKCKLHSYSLGASIGASMSPTKKTTKAIKPKKSPTPIKLYRSPLGRKI